MTTNQLLDLEADVELAKKAEKAEKAREARIRPEEDYVEELVSEWIRTKATYQRAAKDLRGQLVMAEEALRRTSIATAKATGRHLIDRIHAESVHLRNEFEQTRDLIELDLAETGFDISLLV